MAQNHIPFAQNQFFGALNMKVDTDSLMVSFVTTTWNKPRGSEYKNMDFLER